jgi:predicted nucleotidyltransferase
MKIKDEISKRSDVFLSLCKQNGVKELYAFGSSTNLKFDNEQSDIDLIVELNKLDPLEKGERLMNIWDEFEDSFQRKVDLLTENSIKNPYLKKSIDSTKILIYDGRMQKILV